jgi:hypothetical protein
MKKETYLRKAGELYDSIIPIQREIREKSEKYLQMVLAEHNGSIAFDDYDPDTFVSVPYDGGNHPEYASNCFSVVYGIFSEKGKIYLNTGDCSKMTIDDLNWDNVYDVAEYIDTNILDIIDS